jgi:hypothetical protein
MNTETIKAIERATEFVFQWRKDKVRATIGPRTLKNGETVKNFITLEPLEAAKPEPVKAEPVEPGIRWNEGYCWSCGRPVNPYATGCPHCLRSFCD